MRNKTISTVVVLILALLFLCLLGYCMELANRDKDLKTIEPPGHDQTWGLRPYRVT